VKERICVCMFFVSEGSSEPVALGPFASLLTRHVQALLTHAVCAGHRLPAAALQRRSDALVP
jgi:hypothetical protein